FVAGCERNQNPPQYGYNPGQYQPGGYSGQYPPQGYPPGYAPPPGYQQSPNAPAPTVQVNPQQRAPTPADQPVLGPQPNDPITNLDLAWLRSQAGSVMGELIVALPAGNQQKVANIPFF